MSDVMKPHTRYVGRVVGLTRLTDTAAGGHRYLVELLGRLENSNGQPEYYTAPTQPDSDVAHLIPEAELILEPHIYATDQLGRITRVLNRGEHE